MRALLTVALTTASGSLGGPVLPDAAQEPEGDVVRRQRCLSEEYPQSRSDFPQLLNCLGLVGQAVEVGVQAGVHARSFLDGWEGQRLWLVDTWGSEEGSPQGAEQLFYVDIANVQTREIREQHRLHCEARLADALGSGRAQIVNMDSTRAASTVDDGELDFVYLDARHDFAGVVADIQAWWPKVKLGGIFAGHDFVDGEFPEGDFFWKSALREALPELDGLAKVTHEVDKYPSFFIVKDVEHAEARVRHVESEALSRKLYAEKSTYFGLWREMSGDEGHRRFSEACRNACSGHCDDRARRFTPTRTAGSTARPFACAAPAETQSAAGIGAVAEGSAPDTCGAEKVIDVKEYRSICVERCNITCQQRRELFSWFGGEILEV